MLTNIETGEELRFNLISQEQLEYNAEVTKEPTEKGFEVADGVLTKNAVLKVKGKNGVVKLANMGQEITQVSQAISIIARWQQKGQLCKYIYRNGFNNCIIKKFSIKQTSKERYGYEFELELEQVRIAQQVTTKVTGKTKPDGIIAKRIAEKEKKEKGGTRKTTKKKKSKEPTLTQAQKAAIKSKNNEFIGGSK